MISVTPTENQAERLDLENLSAEQTALEIRNLNLHYGDAQALYDISMAIPKIVSLRLSVHQVVVNRPCCAVLTV